MFGNSVRCFFFSWNLSLDFCYQDSIVCFESDCSSWAGVCLINDAFAHSRLSSLQERTGQTCVELLGSVFTLINMQGRLNADVILNGKCTLATTSGIVGMCVYKACIRGLPSHNYVDCSEKSRPFKLVLALMPVCLLKSYKFEGI